MEYKSIIENLAKRISDGKLIGNELIEYLGNIEFEITLREITEKELIRIIENSIYENKNKYILIVGLTYIAMKYYNNSYWNHFEEFYYSQLNYINSTIKVENSIRKIIDDVYYSDKNSRQINNLVSNSIVPINHLSDFFEFVFDIYKLNFEYSLPVDFEDDLDSIFNFLKNSIEENSDDISIDVTKKTYKLRKGTLDIIRTRRDISSLIKFTKKILYIIDKNFYGENIEELNYEYYKFGFDSWNEKVYGKEKIHASSTEKRDNKNKWKPKIKYCNERVVLETPIHRVLDYEDKKINKFNIEILVSNNKKNIYKEKIKNIEEVIGGILKVLPTNIIVNDPIGELKYELRSEGQIIYSSNNSLFRNSIFFDKEGKEIRKYHEYEGNAIVCYKTSNSENIKFQKNKGDFKIGYTYIIPEEVYYFDNEIVFFNELTSNGIEGKKINNAYVMVDNDTYDIYNDIKSIGINTKELLDENDILIKINNINMRNDKYYLKCNKTNFGTKIEFRYNFCNNIYELEIINKRNGAKIEEYKLIYDENFEHTVEKVSNKLYKVCFTSDFLFYNSKKENIYEYFLNTELEAEPEILYYIKDKYGILKLDLEIPMYKIDDGKWHEFEDDLFIYEIKDYSKIFFKGIKNDNILLKDKDGDIIRNLEKNIADIYEIGGIKNIAESYDYIELCIMNQDVENGYIIFNFHPIIDKINSYINFEKKNKKITFCLNYLGDFNLIVKVKQGIREVANYPRIEKGKNYSINNIQSSQKYIIEVFEKKDDIFGSLKNIWKKNIMFFENGDMVNKTLFIKKISYTDFKNDEEIEEKLYNTYLILKYYDISKDEYIGEIYQKRYGKKYKMDNINPIRAKVLEQEEDGTAMLYIKDKNQESLMIDEYNKTILNEEDSKYAQDIESFFVELRKKRKNESNRTNKIYRRKI